MINFKKVAKGVGVVLLVFFLAILAYMFTPFLALLIVSMQSVTAVLLELVILLVFLTISKLLIQVLIGKKMEMKFLKRILTKIPKLNQTVK